MIAPLSLLVIWYALSAIGAISPEIFSPPTDVAKAAWKLTMSGELPGAILASSIRAMNGFAIGASLGAVLALGAGLFRLGEDLIDSVMGMLRTVPFVGMVPLFIVWFGIDETPKIALVAVAVAFPLYFNLYGGIRGVDDTLIEAGTVLGLTRTGLIRYVILPGALPGCLLGVRLSLGISWLALVFAEQLNASTGIGHLMTTAQAFHQSDVLVVCLVTYALLGIVSDLLVRMLERLLLSWRASFRGA